jgi:hypothetical protein
MRPKGRAGRAPRPPRPPAAPAPSLRQVAQPGATRSHLSPYAFKTGSQHNFDNAYLSGTAGVGTQDNTFRSYTRSQICIRSQFCTRMVDLTNAARPGARGARGRDLLQRVHLRLQLRDAGPGSARRNRLERHGRRLLRELEHRPRHLQLVELACRRRRRADLCARWTPKNVIWAQEIFP